MIIGRAFPSRLDQIEEAERFSIGGRHAAPNGGGNECMALLFNRAGSQQRSFWITEIRFDRTDVNNAVAVQLAPSTDAGSLPTTTVTPTINSSWSKEQNPVGSVGAILYLGNFSTQPTRQSPASELTPLSNVAGFGEWFILTGRGRRVAPGSGFGLWTVDLSQPITDITFVYHY